MKRPTIDWKKTTGRQHDAWNKFAKECYTYMDQQELDKQILVDNIKDVVEEYSFMYDGEGVIRKGDLEEIANEVVARSRFDVFPIEENYTIFGKSEIWWYRLITWTLFGACIFREIFK